MLCSDPKFQKKKKKKNDLKAEGWGLESPEINIRATRHNIFL